MRPRNTSIGEPLPGKERTIIPDVAPLIPPARTPAPSPEKAPVREPVTSPEREKVPA